MTKVTDNQLESDWKIICSNLFFILNVTIVFLVVFVVCINKVFMEHKFHC